MRGKYIIIFYTLILFLVLYSSYTSSSSNNDINNSYKKTTRDSLTDTVANNKPDSIEIKKKLTYGKLLYEGKCKRCHTLYEPSDFKLFVWKKNLKEMRIKAGLSKEEYDLILDYLSVNCKK